MSHWGTSDMREKNQTLKSYREQLLVQFDSLLGEIDEVLVDANESRSIKRGTSRNRVATSSSQAKGKGLSRPSL
jgi:hypothetical protein